VGPRADLDDVEKKKFLILPELDSTVIQPIASRNIYYAIPIDTSIPQTLS
jgi:hypothetical protein